MAATLPRVGVTTSAGSNGAYYPPASSDGASDGTPSEEHPEFVDVCVILPNGHTKDFTVEYGKQMMDLLVQVAAGNKLSPASHTIQIFDADSGRPVDYKASQSIGSLKVSTLHLVSKKSDKKSETRKSSQPFEKTQRLTVNLPRNQKFVTRVNPKLRLADIYKLVCEEKKLDPYKYDLRHPTHPDQALNMAAPLGDYGINEIFVVSVGASESRAAADLPVTSPDLVTSAQSETADTMPRLSRKSSASAADDAGTGEGYMPGGEKKKKKGFLSFLSKKKAGSFKLGGTLTTEPMYAQAPPPANHRLSSPPALSSAHSVSSHSSGASGAQSPVSPEPVAVHAAPPPPQAAAVTARAAPVAKPAPAASKRRRAPAPPQLTSSRAAPAPPGPAPTPSPPPPAEAGRISAESPTIEVTPSPTTSPPVPLTTTTTAILNHSRNSSHSSGFDESNVSPIESPGTSTRTDVSSKTLTSSTSLDGHMPSLSETQPSQKTVVVTATTTTKMTKSQSAPLNRASLIRPGEKQLISTATLNALRRKKRKPAPPPPPGAIKAPAPAPPKATAETKLPDVVVVGGSTITPEQPEAVVESVSPPSSPPPVVTEAPPKAPADTTVTAVSQPSNLVNGEQIAMMDNEAEIALSPTHMMELTKGTDVDDGASASSGSLDRNRGPCQFVPPPPPDTPPPPETPISQERARSFNFSLSTATPGGVEVVDTSIQAHVSSPCSVYQRARSTDSLDTLDDITSCFESTIAVAEEALARDEGDTSMQSTSSDPHHDSMTVPDTDSISDTGSSVQGYEVNAVQEDEEKKDNEKNFSDEDISLYPDDPEGIVLIKKTSTSDFISANLLAQQKAEKEEINERKVAESSEVTGEPKAETQHVTVVSVGGEVDITGASDSGHSSATMDKSEDHLDGDIMENEITFGEEDVMYVQPLNPVDPVAKEEYLNQVERERIEYEALAAEQEKEIALKEAAEEEERKRRDKEEEEGRAMQRKLQEAREAAARASEAYENKSTPRKPSNPEGPLTTSTPMAQSVSSLPSGEQDSFYKPPSPVLTTTTEDTVDEAVRSRKVSESLSEEGGDVFVNPEETMITLNDYRIAGLIKEEVVEFSFPKHSKPIEVKPKKEEPKAPMVTSLRQRYVRRPVLPQEPVDVPDLEALGLIGPKKNLPPPPSEPAPPIPSEPSEPLVIKTEPKLETTEKVYIAPSEESVTDSEGGFVFTEVTATGEPIQHIEEASELSIPNEAEPETLERDKAMEAYLVSQTKTEVRPVGILKQSSFNESSTSAPTKGILKTSSVDPSHSGSRPTSILKNKDNPAHIHSSTGSLEKDEPDIVSSKPYASASNLSSEKDIDTQVTRPSINYTKRGLGVYGPRPWGASKLKTDTNIEINTNFSDRYNSSELSPRQKTDDVRQKLDALGFSPGMERESENVLEEKSLSMMNLQSSVRSTTETKDIKTKQQQRPASGSIPDLVDPKSLQTQYEDLQKQFNRWQKQLQDNQALLSQKNISSQKESMPEKPPSSPHKVDARYEPPKKTGPDTGGGGRFTTNDLLSARSRLKSSVSDEDTTEKCGITVGRIVDTVPSPQPVVATKTVPIPPPVSSIPHTPAPDTTQFPAPPKRVILDRPRPKDNNNDSRFGPKLDAREDLMLTIRNSGGRTALRKVPVNETNWE